LLSEFNQITSDELIDDELGLDDLIAFLKGKVGEIKKKDDDLDWKNKRLNKIK